MKRITCLTLAAGLVLSHSASYASDWQTDPDVSTILIDVYDNAGNRLASTGPYSWALNGWMLANAPAGNALSVDVYLFSAAGDALYAGRLDGVTITDPGIPMGPMGPLPPIPSILSFFPSPDGIVMMSMVGEVYTIPLQPILTIMDVVVDVKPGSADNPVNVRSKGLVPVAILGSADLDVTTIDVSTLRVKDLVPVKTKVVDVSNDGVLDLMTFVSTEQLASVLGNAGNGDVIEVDVTGNLVNGTAVIGVDTLKVLVSKGKKK